MCVLCSIVLVCFVLCCIGMPFLLFKWCANFVFGSLRKLVIFFPRKLLTLQFPVLFISNNADFPTLPCPEYVTTCFMQCLNNNGNKANEIAKRLTPADRTGLQSSLSCEGGPGEPNVDGPAQSPTAFTNGFGSTRLNTMSWYSVMEAPEPSTFWMCTCQAKRASAQMISFKATHYAIITLAADPAKLARHQQSCNRWAS